MISCLSRISLDIKTRRTIWYVATLNLVIPLSLQSTDPPDTDPSGFSSLLSCHQRKIDHISNNCRMPDLYIIGDLNFLQINWKMPVSSLSTSASDLFDFMDSNKQCSRGNEKEKLNARIRALQEKKSQSCILPKLTEEVNLPVYNTQSEMLKNLNPREEKAVETIRSNPKYVFSYAKLIQKTKSTIPVLRDHPIS